MDQEYMSLMAELGEGPPPQQVQPISQKFIFSVEFSDAFERCPPKLWLSAVPCSILYTKGSLGNPGWTDGSTFNSSFPSRPPASWLDWKLWGHSASSDATASARYYS